MSYLGNVSPTLNDRPRRLDEFQDVVVSCWDATNNRYLDSFGAVTLDGVTKNADGRTNIIFSLEVGRHAIKIKNLKPGYSFDHWESTGGNSWVEVLIDVPNSPSTGLTTHRNGPGSLLIYVTKIPEVPDLTRLLAPLVIGAILTAYSLS